MSEPTIIRRTATVENVFFGEGYFNLSLPIGQLEDLQDILDCGPVELATHLTAGTWRLKHLKETWRVALIGGGMDPQKAFNLVNRTIKEGYLLEHVSAARAVVLAALAGIPEDQPGEPQAATEMETEAAPEKSNGLPSTSSQAPQDTPPSK